MNCSFHFFGLTVRRFLVSVLVYVHNIRRNFLNIEYSLFKLYTDLSTLLLNNMVGLILKILIEGFRVLHRSSHSFLYNRSLAEPYSVEGGYLFKSFISPHILVFTMS